MKKNNIMCENYLELCPKISEKINWSEKEGKIVLEIKNHGIFNTIAQKLFKKPEISYVNLEEIGTFIWPLLDGKTNIIDIGIKVRERFGERAEPLYERLAKYIKVLESYNFVECK